MITFGFGKAGLGPLDRVYLNRIREWRNDPRVFKWCRQFDQINEAEHERWFDSQALSPTTRMYAIHWGGHGDGMCGVAGLTSIDHVNRRAEFSLYIAPDMHRKGYGRPALATLLSHGFQNLGLATVWGETFNGNPAARMFEGMGFIKEGMRRQFYYREGRFIDALLYSITEGEWRVASSRVSARSQGRP
jgi:ribosomal-protein-alanine N-acetyltransferase